MLRRLILELRWRLIKLLAGSDVVALNLTVRDGEFEVDGEGHAFISQCRFIWSQEE